jgi:hypothetical protein
MSSKDEEIKRVMQSERQRGRRPVDYDERARKQELRNELLKAIKESDWSRIKEALLLQYEKDSSEYKAAIAAIKKISPSADL